NYVQSAKDEINRRLDSIAEHGRNPLPAHVKFTTWTLRYNTMNWVRIDALEHHWERAQVDAQIVDAGTVHVSTKNVTALSLAMESGLCPLEMTGVSVVLDGQQLAAPAPLSDRSWSAHFRKTGSKWEVGEMPANVLLKRHDLKARSTTLSWIHSSSSNQRENRSTRRLAPGPHASRLTPSTPGENNSAAKRVSKTTRPSRKPTSHRAT